MIYLDYNATTPIDKEVANAMLSYLYGNFGNPSSSHKLGVTAKNAVEHARVQVTGLLNCSPEEIIFTSGGESNNMVIKGVAHTYKNQLQLPFHDVSLAHVSFDSILLKQSHA